MKKVEIKDLDVLLQDKIYNYPKVFGSLTSSMIVQVYEPNETIIHFNRPIHQLRFLIEGRGKITLVHENGNQSIVHFVHPGEYLGELTFLEIEKVHKNVIAISRCIFVSIDMGEALKILKNESKFLFELCQFVGDKMLKRTYFSSKNQSYELINRLAAYILTTQNEGIYSEKHTETAEYLGVSYRHLLHTFKILLDNKSLTKLKKGYEYNKQVLEELAKDIRF